MNNCRQTRAERQKEILKAAVAIATAKGLPAVSGNTIAKYLDLSRPAVMYHITSMASIRDAVMCEAVSSEMLPVIAHGLAVGNPIAKAAPAKLRRKAVESLL